MDTLDLSSVLTPDFWFQQFGNLDGVHTGVPTLTTPTLTLTPSTFRNIEESIIQIQRESQSHHNEAGFVPPVIEPVSQGKNTFLNLVDRQALLGGSTTITPTPAVPANRPPSMLGQMSYVSNPAPLATRRNVGGRRPNKSTGISPEEEERRRVRRERNKLAAARCRKRRMDHTNELLMETEDLERKKQGLQNEIKRLQDEKGQLEFLLEAHQAVCGQNSLEQPPSPPEVKPLIAVPYHNEPRVVVQSQPRCDTAAFAPSSLSTAPRRPQFGATAGSKPSRPSSLPVGTKPFEVDGVPITTPSTVIPFNFDSLMDGGTGLTPVSSTGLSPLIPSCSSQQRNQGVDLSSPDNAYPPKLVSL